MKWKHSAKKNSWFMHYNSVFDHQEVKSQVVRLKINFQKALVIKKIISNHLPQQFSKFDLRKDQRLFSIFSYISWSIWIIYHLIWKIKSKHHFFKRNGLMIAELFYLCQEELKCSGSCCGFTSDLMIHQPDWKIDS